MKYGIDVCSYQGNIDWAKVKKAGCTFAVLKCIRKDLNPDTAFARNVAGCRWNGIPVSVYTYVYENTVEGAEKRAKAAVKACQKLGVKGCVIWWDVEDKSIRRTGVDSRARLTKSILAARAIISAAGFGFGVYCDTNFYTTCLNANHIKGRWWIAAYHGNPVTAFGKAPGYKKPTIANELCGWQYCSRGRVPGISGSVDLDIAYDSDFTEGSVTAVKPTSVTGNPYPAPTGTLREGDSGEQVKWVQWELKRLGYDIGKSGVDGQYGPATKKAVEAFQKDFGLTVDGLAGKQTWAAMVKATEKPKPVEKTVNWRERVAEAAKKVYPLCVGKVHSGANVGKVDSLSTLKQYKALSCNRMVSITLQEAGLLPKGCIVAHTDKRAGKKSITDAVTGTAKLKHCKLYWVNKLYKDLPEKWKRAGVVYFYNSNAAISAGGGKIWSCNRSSGHRYAGTGDYLRTGGYPFTRILGVIEPDE